MKTITMEAVEKLKAIDHNSYIQKNLLMCRFDKIFGTKLTRFDADDLSFIDILQAPKYADINMIYSELKKIVKEGVTVEEKDFIYNVTNTCLQNSSGKDFDALIKLFFTQLRAVSNWQSVMNFPCLYEDIREESVFYFHKTPFEMTEYIIELPWGIRTEAILIRNGYIMNVQIVKKLTDISKLWPVLYMKGKNGFYCFERRI